MGGATLTVAPEVRFRCDRCRTDEVVPLSSTPITTRFNAPGQWLTLKVNDEELLRHLCPSCAELFNDLFKPPEF